MAAARTRTRADGHWGPVKLRSRRGVPHAVGDDREGLAVAYGGAHPTADLIATGDGGNPFTESGYTGWFDLDHGFAVGARSVALGPCGQTGVLSLRVGSKLTEPPAQLCSTEAGAALIPTGMLGPGTRLTMSSEDNRAESLLEPNGALVKLTVSLGEPLSVPTADNGRLLFLLTGFPQCTALLREQSVRCTGLVPEAHYRLGHRRAQAGLGGTISVRGLRAARRRRVGAGQLRRPPSDHPACSAPAGSHHRPPDPDRVRNLSARRLLRAAAEQGPGVRPGR